MNNLGCSFLEQGINFDLNKVTDCCIMHNDGRGLPILIEDYHGEPIDWNKIFEIKAKRIAEQKEETIYDCEGCYHMGDFEFTDTRKISEFHFSQCRVCNAKCVYCSEENYGLTLNYSPYPVVKDLIEKGFYKAGGEATFQGGEPLVMPNFDELVALLLEKGTSIRVHSSAIKFSDPVYEALKQNKGVVVTSLDSGCSETYKKIKRTDKFNEVVENLKKYIFANDEKVVIKYLIVPGYNDNIAEIDKFMALMKQLNVKKLALDIEVKYAMKYNNKDVSDHIFMLIDYFNIEAKKLGMHVQVYSFLSYVIKNRTLPVVDKIENKFIYGIKMFFKNNKGKNLKYIKN